MSGLKEIRNRISSVSSTMQITNAMKMVSAAKLKKAQDRITATLPYSNKLSELIKSISASVDSDESSPLFEKRELKKPLLIVITSNKGLCGGFNSSIIKEVYNLSAKYGSNTPDLLTIGKKGNLEKVEEQRIEVIFPDYLKGTILSALKKTHPYEEVAYYLHDTLNKNPAVGAGLVGELQEGINTLDFLHFLKKEFNLKVIKHTAILKDKINIIKFFEKKYSF